MDTQFQKKTSSFLLTALIGIIVLSFMFGGYDSLQRGSVDTIAKVGKFPIKVAEYQNEYNRQLQFYTQIFGGNITSKQIEQFRIKENVLQSLVNQKLILNLAKDLGITVSSLEVKSEIKNLPYFKTNEKFDLEKYKLILARNGHTPSDFEELISHDILMKKAQSLVTTLPISNKYQAEIENLKKEELVGKAVVINKSDLFHFVSVNSKEIGDFLADPSNRQRVDALFKDRQKSLSQRDEVKARHILIKLDGKKEADVKKEIVEMKKGLTKGNFSEIANKRTEDPSGKGKGGSLDWFGKGMMAPEFEKVAFSLKVGEISEPVKTQFGYHLIIVDDKKVAKEALLADHEKSIATELIQKSKDEEQTKIEEKIIKELTPLLMSKNGKELEKKANEYKLTLVDKLMINKIDGTKGSLNLSFEEINELFKNSNDKEMFHKFGGAGTTTLLSVAKIEAKSNPKDKLAANDQALIRKFNQELIKELEKNIKVKVYSDLL